MDVQQDQQMPPDAFEAVEEVAAELAGDGVEHNLGDLLGRLAVLVECIERAAVGVQIDQEGFTPADEHCLVVVALRGGRAVAVLEVRASVELPVLHAPCEVVVVGLPVAVAQLERAQVQPWARHRRAGG